MSGFRDYVITQPAINQATQLGLGGDVAARVARMAKRAARLTHPCANYRFEGFAFQIADGEVKAVYRYDETKDFVYV